MKKFYKMIATVLAVCICFSIFALTACGGENGTSGTIVTITYDTEVAGLTIEPTKAEPGKKIDPPADPVREGYRFEGWSLNGEPFEFTVMPNESVTLKAIWNKVYSVTFDTGVSGYHVSPIVEPAGTEISAPFVNRPGYHLKYWKLNGEPYHFTVMPDEDITLEAEWSEELTNLPALFIDLSDANGNQINLAEVDADVKKSYVKSTISLSNTEDDYILSSLGSQFKGRGNGSWNEAKKGYKIKFDKKQSLFGRAANKHWVIIACANFDDPTMSRNYLAYNMAGEVFDAIEYTTNAVWVDVYVNGEYRGVYVLCEHVRVGTGRVDIESEYTNEPEANGFLIEYDAYTAGTEGVDYFRLPNVNLKYGFSMHSPDPEDYAEEITKAEYQHQVSYIQDYVTQVYNAALSKNYTKFSELADVDSFVDMYILHELFKNMDTGYSSFYLYKKPNGKLYAGPPWDFDATTSADDGNGRGDRSPQGIYVATGAGSDNTKCELYMALYQTTAFKNAVKARWKTLSPEITKYLDKAMNDTVYAANKQAMGKNYAMWKGKTQTAAANDWVNDMKALKKWLGDRTTWLDKEWK